jgi:peptide chain release factor 3
VLRHPDLGDVEPMLAAVGALQFDVAAYRMEHEFNAPVRLRGSRFEVARRTDEGSVPALQAMPDVGVYRRANGTPMALFRDRWQVQRIEQNHPELTLDTIMTS